MHTMKVLPRIKMETFVALHESEFGLYSTLKARRTYLQLIAHPITPKALPVRKKLRRPKMSLHLPAMVMTTALDRDHAVAIQAILLEGPMS